MPSRTPNNRLSTADAVAKSLAFLTLGHRLAKEAVQHRSNALRLRRSKNTAQNLGRLRHHVGQFQEKTDLSKRSLARAKQLAGVVAARRVR